MSAAAVCGGCRKKIDFQNDAYIRSDGANFHTTCFKHPICANCNRDITKGQVVKVLGKTWHHLCFACHGCKGPLIDGGFIPINDYPYCDYCFENSAKTQVVVSEKNDKPKKSDRMFSCTSSFYDAFKSLQLSPGEDLDKKITEAESSGDLIPKKVVAKPKEGDAEKGAASVMALFNNPVAQANTPSSPRSNPTASPRSNIPASPRSNSAVSPRNNPSSSPRSNPSPSPSPRGSSKSSEKSSSRRRDKESSDRKKDSKKDSDRKKERSEKKSSDREKRSHRSDKSDKPKREKKPSSTSSSTSSSTTQCVECKKKLSGRVIKALGKKWHVDCFVCTICKKKLPPEFNEHEGLPYCEADYEKSYAPKCGKCNQLLSGAVLRALGKKWHKSCFVCAKCQGPFVSGSFFVREGMPFCDRC